MASQRILVPYNFTSHDLRALDFVAQTYAGQNEVEITLFNTFIPAPEVKLRNAPILENLKDKIGYLSKKTSEQEKELISARKSLLKRGFSEDQVRYIYKPKINTTANEIIDLVKNEQINVIVLNHKPSKATRVFTGNVFIQIVNTLKEVTISIVT